MTKEYWLLDQIIRSTTRQRCAEYAIFSQEEIDFATHYLGDYWKANTVVLPVHGEPSNFRVWTIQEYENSQAKRDEAKLKMVPDYCAMLVEIRYVKRFPEISPQMAKASIQTAIATEGAKNPTLYRVWSEYMAKFAAVEPREIENLRLALGEEIR